MGYQTPEQIKAAQRMASRPRSFGWSAKQMSQINSRREARGQSPYIDRRMLEDPGYQSEYSSASEDYAERQARLQKQQTDRDEEEDARRNRFAQQSASAKQGMRQREQEREDLGRMNVDYLKMRRSGGKLSWEDFKKMWKGKKMQTSPQTKTYA